MAKKSAAHSGQIVGISSVLQVGLWILILVFAFFMQVIPFLLVLTAIWSLRQTRHVRKEGRLLATAS